VHEFLPGCPAPVRLLLWSNKWEKKERIKISKAKTHGKLNFGKGNFHFTWYNWNRNFKKLEFLQENSLNKLDIYQQCMYTYTV